MIRKPVIKAVSVNHNTTKYMELMIRSLFHRNVLESFDFELTVFENGSQEDSSEDVSSLKQLAQMFKFEYRPSGYAINEKWNSHGAILDMFVKTHRECDYYLLLDADIVFLREDTIIQMLQTMEQYPQAYGTGPYYSWDGYNKMPTPEQQPGVPDVYECRLHPCCALLRNDPVLHKVVEQVGFGNYKQLLEGQEDYLDTGQLLTRVMKTHDRFHVRTDTLILHFFCTSYKWDPEELVLKKAMQRDDLLKAIIAESQNSDLCLAPEFKGENS